MNYHAVVFENGSSRCKAGFADEESPVITIPTAVGRSRSNIAEDCYVGNSTQRWRNILSLRYPIERGIVTNWDDMETIWRHMYREGLGVSPEAQPVFMCEQFLNPSMHREKMAQVMFERFQVPGLFVQDKAYLAYNGYCAGTALILHIGDGVTFTFPAYEYYALSHAARRQDLAGRDVTDALSKLLRQRNADFATSADLMTTRLIKEQLAYVAMDVDEEEKRTSNPSQNVEQRFVLDSGEKVLLEKERFKCCEILFNPQQFGLDMIGLHQMVFNTLMACDVDTRRELGAKVFLSGGSSFLPGLADRLAMELRCLAPHMKDIQVKMKEDSHLIAWIGGSISAANFLYQCKWVSKAEYEEVGPSIMRQRGWEAYAPHPERALL